MNTAQHSAKLFLISVGTHLAYGHEDENVAVWHDAVRDADPYLKELPPTLEAVLDGVRMVMSAKTPRERHNARSRLQIEVRKYAQGSAAYHHEAIKLAAQGRGRSNAS